MLCKKGWYRLLVFQNMQDVDLQCPPTLKIMRNITVYSYFSLVQSRVFLQQIEQNMTTKTFGKALLVIDIQENLLNPY